MRNRARSSIASCPMFISGTSTVRYRRNTSPDVAGNGFNQRRCAVATLLTAAADPRDGRPDGARDRAPAEDQHLRVPVRVVDLQRREIGGDPLDLGRAEVRHPLVVLRLVADVPGHVLTLQTADPVDRARPCPARPTAVPAGRRARMA